MTYKYAVGDKIVTTNGESGTITDLQVSKIDNKDFPSYWVVYSKELFPDGYARNTWESMIKTKFK